MKILVVGTCQAPEVGRCLQVLLPPAEVEFHEWVTLDRRAGFAALAERLPSFDLVFAQSQQDRYAELSDAVLQQGARKLRFFPIVSFTGLHPDSVYLPGNLEGPMGAYHSGLIVAAFRLGIPERDVPSLFNALVFGALGYFREAAVSRSYFLDSATALGYDLAAAFDGWMAGGAFLYTLNHPRAPVIETLARQLLAKEGIEAADVGTARLPPSQLEQGEIWPVYPEIARRLGFKGSTAFVPRQLKPGRRKPLSLEAFVARSYALYATVPDDRLADSRILQLQAALSRLQRRGYDTTVRGEGEMQNRRMVQSLYRAILCRDADEGGLEEYVGRLDRGGVDAIEDVVAALARSPEAMALHALQLAQQQDELDRNA